MEIYILLGKVEGLYACYFTTREAAEAELEQLRQTYDNTRWGKIDYRVEVLYLAQSDPSMNEPTPSIDLGEW